MSTLPRTGFKTGNYFIWFEWIPTLELEYVIGVKSSKFVLVSGGGVTHIFYFYGLATYVFAFVNIIVVKKS